jgi:hypothetical protein
VLAHFVAYAETHGVAGTSRCPALLDLAVRADA